MADTFSIIKRKSKPKFKKEKKTPKSSAVPKQKVRVTSTRRAEPAAAAKDRPKRTSPAKTRAKRTLYEDTIHVTSRYRGEAPTSAFSAIQAKKRTRKILWAVFSAVFVVALTAVLVWICLLYFFKVESINCEGITLYEGDEIIEASGITIGEQMFHINSSAIEKALCERYPYLINVQIRREMPSTIVIKAEEDTAAYYIALCGEYCILSEQMRVLEMVSDEDIVTSRHKGIVKLALPRVTGAIVGSEVEFLHTRNKAYINQVINALLHSERSQSVKYIDLSNKFDIKFNYAGRIDVLLGDESNVEEKIQFAFKMIDDYSDFATGEVSVENLETGYVMIKDPQGE
ncbi:MAG: FtsQ-type POTRA domain-containing protein [Clostridiales bacterium]|nr:FtsQ-type POTRA domain-containing protein [Clostridiales bacterium]